MLTKPKNNNQGVPFRGKDRKHTQVTQLLTYLGFLRHSHVTIFPWLAGKFRMAWRQKSRLSGAEVKTKERVRGRTTP
jgi:hypothetical protein